MSISRPAHAAIPSTLERALRRDRAIVCVALAAVVIAAWAYLLAGAGMQASAIEMTRMSTRDAENVMAAGGMHGAPQWTVTHALIMLGMWWVMMIAMMLPSAAPMILLFAAVNRKQRLRGATHVPVSLFAGAYLLTWGVFSVAAVAAQWGLQEIGWLSAMLVSRSEELNGGLLLLAGAYQLTPLKQACLRQCRGPFQFIATRWRRGALGALRMGIAHGTFCVGCCWLLMVLLFVGGVMNLWWIVGLSLFVLLEKTVPAGHWFGMVLGMVLVGAGAWQLIA